MKIHGLVKTTLLDYPGHLACTIFLGKCNFMCPYCQNASLVLHPNIEPTIDEEVFFSYLDKRSGILEGVCISGGEPTIHDALPELIAKIKSLKLLVKLDTNGSNPEMLSYLISERLVDYIAMDIKNRPEKYTATIDMPSVNINNIKKSIQLLIDSPVPYEFRTTVLQEFHTRHDFIEIAHFIQGAKHYYLQQYTDRDSNIQNGFTSYSSEELEQVKIQLETIIPHVAIRG